MKRERRDTLSLVLLALCGLIAAAALGFAANALTNDSIGLSAEPPGIGRELIDDDIPRGDDRGARRNRDDGRGRGDDSPSGTTTGAPATEFGAQTAPPHETTTTSARGGDGLGSDDTGSDDSGNSGDDSSGSGSDDNSGSSHSNSGSGSSSSGSGSGSGGSGSDDSSGPGPGNDEPEFEDD